MPKAAQLEFKSSYATGTVTISVGGDFNDWAGSAKGRFDPSQCKMTRKEHGRFVFPLNGLAPGRHEFKYIINGQWEACSNRTFYLDEKGRLTDPTGGIISAVLENPGTIRVLFSAMANLPTFLDKESFAILPHGTVLGLTRKDGFQGDGETIDLYCRPISVLENLELEVKGLADKPVVRPIHLDGLFRQAFISDKMLGPSVEGSPPFTVFRVFAPRATRVVLQHFADPAMEHVLTKVNGVKDSDGVWEMRLEKTHWGTYYGFNVEGPKGEGEGFNPLKVWPDPWCRASIFHNGPSILVDPDATGDGFEGWTDMGFKTPSKPDLVIYECSVRDLTSDPSSGTAPNLRGKYLGLTSTIGTGFGIDHVKKLGANAMEFLPIFEFDDDPPGTYHWGYMPSLYFAPEASFACNPKGGQVNEFKALVNALHGQGIAVILDVVYNHTGAPQVLMGFDKKYFYRLDGSNALLNFSGCGNDFKTESPMARRLILDSLEYWVREFHIDGFRFDLAELIDHETLLAIEKRLVPIKPDVILIAEPWSFRGNNKGRLNGTNWTSWNDDFRNHVKDAVLGNGDINGLYHVLKGSVDLWTGQPIESVNYVESHDNFTLIDHLSRRVDHDGTNATGLDIRRDLFCAAATLLSPGIPMIAEGQEMLRSKGGNGNSYNAGDAVNAIDYTLREKNPKVLKFYRDLIAFRKSDAGMIIREADATAVRNIERLPGSLPGSVGLAWKVPELQLLPQASGQAARQASGQTLPPAIRKAARQAVRLLALFNADSETSANFKVHLQSGAWTRLFGDGRLFSMTELSRREVQVSHSDDDGVSFEVPPLGVEVWVPKRRPAD